MSLTGAAAVVLTGPMAGQAAAETAREDVVVPAAAVAGVVSQATLGAGVQYDLVVQGTFARSGGAPADAECWSDSFGVVWSADRASRVSLDLLVNGHDLRWSPVGPGGLGCDTSSHTYRASFTPAMDGPLQLRVDGDNDQARYEGNLLVRIEGAAFAPDPAGDDEPAATPPSSVPPTTQPQPQSAPSAPPASTPAPQPGAAPTSERPNPGPAATSPAALPVSTPTTAPVVPTPAEGPAPAQSAAAARDELFALLLDEPESTDDPVARRDDVELVVQPPARGDVPTDGLVLGILVLGAIAAGATGVGVPAVRLATGAMARRRRPNPWRPRRSRREPTATPPIPAASALERSFFS